MVYYIYVNLCRFYKVVTFFFEKIISSKRNVQIKLKKIWYVFFDREFYMKNLRLHLDLDLTVAECLIEKN